MTGTAYSFTRCLESIRPEYCQPFQRPAARAPTARCARKLDDGLISECVHRREKSQLRYKVNGSPSPSPSTSCRLSCTRPANLGTLAKKSQADTATDASPDTTWRGKLTCETQNQIPQSEYHPRFEGEIEENGDLERTHQNITYWSDYTHVFLDPKYIQPIPDAHWKVPRLCGMLLDTELIEWTFRLLVAATEATNISSTDIPQI
ncbi:hypothetical protein DFJ58DRAFT_918329 [Suillus subalutaceus]|uniref:uncharacterized protein n=1 Tax=Suillus subalutaceus TaxID=48586 RepID=UPI001B875BE6|nr:uncharacterized protein DFJ58DRAFT_918329 [Suillus subalutaceus]KAG1830678.1 hypothetical protein DFJ58DRAFT_918329 [Suillus subalutaceus]